MRWHVAAGLPDTLETQSATTMTVAAHLRWLGLANNRNRDLFIGRPPNLQIQHGSFVCLEGKTIHEITLTNEIWLVLFGVFSWIGSFVIATLHSET
jgi:hypothetical protein